jgi:hypothetical protein
MVGLIAWSFARLIALLAQHLAFHSVRILSRLSFTFLLSLIGWGITAAVAGFVGVQVSAERLVQAWAERISHFIPPEHTEHMHQALTIVAYVFVVGGWIVAGVLAALVLRIIFWLN